MDNAWMDWYGCLPIKLYWQKQVVGQNCPIGQFAKLWPSYLTLILKAWKRGRLGWRGALGPVGSWIRETDSQASGVHAMLPTPLSNLWSGPLHSSMPRVSGIQNRRTPPNSRTKLPCLPPVPKLPPPRVKENLWGSSPQPAPPLSSLSLLWSHQMSVTQRHCLEAQATPCIIANLTPTCKPIRGKRGDGTHLLSFGCYCHHRFS